MALDTVIRVGEVLVAAPAQPPPPVDFQGTPIKADHPKSSSDPFTSSPPASRYKLRARTPWLRSTSGTPTPTPRKPISRKRPRDQSTEDVQDDEDVKPATPGSPTKRLKYEEVRKKNADGTIEKMVVYEELREKEIPDRIKHGLDGEFIASPLSLHPQVMDWRCPWLIFVLPLHFQSCSAV